MSIQQNSKRTCTSRHALILSQQKNRTNNQCVLVSLAPAVRGHHYSIDYLGHIRCMLSSPFGGHSQISLLTHGSFKPTDVQDIAQNPILIYGKNLPMPNHMSSRDRMQYQEQQPMVTHESSTSRSRLIALASLAISTHSTHVAPFKMKHSTMHGSSFLRKTLGMQTSICFDSHVLIFSELFKRSVSPKHEDKLLVYLRAKASLHLSLKRRPHGRLSDRRACSSGETQLKAETRLNLLDMVV